MPKRLLKQFAYGSVFLLVLFGIGFLFYRAGLPAPGCTNGRQDPGEEGPDCGGVCARLCLPDDIAPLTGAALRVMHPAPGTLAVFSELVNSNPDWSADNVNYRLDLYDASGVKLGALLSPATFVYAAQKKQLADFWQDPAADKVSRAEFVLSAPEWLPRARFFPPQIAVQSSALATSSLGIQVTGKVRNKDTVSLSGVQVLVVFYDKYRFPLGVSRTELSALPPGESEDFTVLYPALPALDPARFDVYPFARRPAF